MEFIAKGRLTLEGITFYIKAPDMTAAKRRAADGEYDSYDEAEAEMVDASIQLSTVKENK